MKKIVLAILISLPMIAQAGFDGANAAAGSGQAVGGASGGYNYIGRGNQVGKPADSGSKSGGGVPAGSKGALGGQPGGKAGGGRGDTVGKNK